MANVLDTSPLLEHLEKDADKDTAEISASSETLEAIGPSRLRNVDFVLIVGLNLGELVFDICRITRLPTDTRERVQSFLVAAFLDKPTRRLREKEKTNSENHGPNPLDGNRDTIRARVIVFVGSLVHTGCEQQTLFEIVSNGRLARRLYVQL